MIGTCWLFLFLNKGQWNWICVMACGREKIGLSWRNFLQWHLRSSLLQAQHWFSLFGFLNLITGMTADVHERGNHRSYTNVVFHAYSLHTCQNRGRAEYLPAMLCSNYIAVAAPIFSKEQFGPSHCLCHFSCFRIPRTSRTYRLLALSSFDTMGRHNWKNLS